MQSVKSSLRPWNEIFKRILNYYSLPPIVVNFNMKRQPSICSVVKTLVSSSGKLQRLIWSGKCLIPRSIFIPVGFQLGFPAEANSCTKCAKELSFCHKLWFYNRHIFSTWWCKPLIHQTFIIWSKEIHGLKYLRSPTVKWKDIGKRKSEFVTKTQFLCLRIPQTFARNSTFLCKNLLPLETLVGTRRW